MRFWTDRLAGSAAAPVGGYRLSRRSLLGLWLLALVPRLALVVVFLDSPIGLDDMYQYDMLGRSIAAGQGYRWYGRSDVLRLQPYLDEYYELDLPVDSIPAEGFVTTFRPPGYPLFLALIYAVVGLPTRIQAARLAQALVGALLAPGAASLALALGLRPSAARVAGVGLALYPVLWMYPIGLGSENLFLPALLFGLLLTLAAGRSSRMTTAALAGGLLGFATLIRGALILFLPVAALWLAWPFARGRSRLRLGLLFSAAAGLVLLPWIVRNSLVLGRPAFVDNSAGYNLYVGYYPQGDGAFNPQAAVQPLRFLDDGERDRWATAQALQFIRGDPLRATWLLASRLSRFWGLEDRELAFFYSNGYLGEIAQPWLAAAYAWLVLPWALVSFAAPWGMAWAGARRPIALALGLVAATLLAYVPILSDARFHLPLVPLLACYAGAAWTAPAPLRRIARGLRAGQASAWIALSVVALLAGLCAWDFARDLPRLAAILASGGSRTYFSY